MAAKAIKQVLPKLSLFWFTGGCIDSLIALTAFERSVAKHVQGSHTYQCFSSTDYFCLNPGQEHYVVFLEKAFDSHSASQPRCLNG